MGPQSRGLAILSFAVTMLAIGFECASAEECDYETCGALMARDGSMSWAVSGRSDYSPDTKRAVLNSMPAYVAPKTTRPDEQWPHLLQAQAH